MLEQKQMIAVEPFGEGTEYTQELRDALHALQELDGDMYATIVDAANDAMDKAHDIGCINHAVGDYNMKLAALAEGAATIDAQHAATAI